MNVVGNSIVYCVIALSIIVFSVLSVTSRKILRSATYLLFTLFATAALYFQLGYEFLGAVQIAVYAGGILVLFVFSILLTSKPGNNAERLASNVKHSDLSQPLPVLPYVATPCSHSLVERQCHCCRRPAM